jgi:type VI secretion system protein VasJ
MELSEYRQCVTAPIGEENPIGQRLLDDPLYDFIEEQMMKVGSLAHGSVQWGEVEHSVLQLLKEKSKDIKLLVYLLQCLHYQPVPDRFNLSILLLTDFVSLYWEESYPAPGPRGELPRRKFFGQIIQRMNMAADKQDFQRFSGELMSDLESALREFETVMKAKSLANDDSHAFVHNVRTKISLVEQQMQRIEQQSEKAKIPPQYAVSNTFSIDSSSNKATKQTLLKVADFLTEQPDGMALSIRLRRHAVWSGITSEPDYHGDGETGLRPMQKDRVKDYQDMMSSPDLSLWRKIEQSLTVAPYWFEGQMMSFEIAQALDKKGWSCAIQEETCMFLERLPGLKALKFKGGEPFVPDHVAAWLDEQERPVVGSVAGSWQEKRKEAFTLAKDAGIAVALSMINGGLESAAEPRDRFYWRLLSADMLNDHGFTAMAEEQYRTLFHQVAAASVSEWEPSLMQKLEKYSTSE